MRKITSLSPPPIGSNYSCIDRKTAFNIKAINKFKRIAAAIALSLCAAPEKASAACAPTPADDVTTICDASSVQTTTLGNGPGLNNVIIDVLPSARIDTGELSAISLDSGSVITLQENAEVKNNANGTAGTGNWGAGQNTIEFNSNTVLTINQGAQVLAQGTAGSGSAIFIRTFGNTIFNHGTIQSVNSPTILLGGNTTSLVSTIDNYGIISATSPENIVIESEGNNIELINRPGGVIIGSIKLGVLGPNNIVIEAGSTLDSEYIDASLVEKGSSFVLRDGDAGTPPVVNTITTNILNFTRIFKSGYSTWLITSPIVVGTSLYVTNGTLALSGDNTYTGGTFINGGTLAALAAGAFSPNSAYIIAAPGAMDLNGFSQTIASVDNAGGINLNGANAGTVLTVTGDYTGNNGRLNFNAKLSDDASQSERLIVEGNTSGDTQVTVNNVGGSGAQTLDGIELIRVEGASNGEFTQSGRIVAGAYDYTLARGTDANAANWYLNSSLTPSEPIPDPHPDPGDMVERPEDSSYGVNLAAANTLFAAGRDTRSVLTTYIDPITGQQQTTSLWMANIGGHNRSRDDSGQLRTQSNRYVLQLGGDVGQWSSNDIDSFRLGVMAGYGNAKSTTVSQVSGYRAKGSVNGYSVGLYGTWYADAAGHDGLYVDGWTQYGWFDNEVNGQDLGEQDYKSKGFTASLETGYAFTIGANPAKNAIYYIEPQAQAIWMDVKADDLTEANGTRVTGEGDGNIQTRLGVKAFMNAYSERDKNRDRLFQPFVEANWIHNSKDFGATLNGVTISQDGAANIGELKIGVNGQLNKNFNLWGSVGQQVGNKGYSDTAGMLGLKYLF
ncbi:autotransporter family porin [Sodalis ligni]|uniref:Autotransporter family porin n=1 Tax=Sodalis ligni TaxID=2697027 RepID=A0A4R1NBU1_9GAMM|nr:autotransporter family porin [Sodalis ligni]